MHRITERVEDGCDFPVDGRIMPPDVAHRQGDVLGECAWPVNAYALRVSAKMAPARQAIAAAAANDVTFTADNFAGMKIVDVRANFCNFADKLVADGHRHGDRVPRPLVPLIDMEISSTDSGVRYAD